MRILGGNRDGKPQLYRESSGIIYAPGIYLERVGGKLVFKPTTVDALLHAPELQPDHLRESGVESKIDPITGNVVYALKEGSARIGFYDRTNAEKANARGDGVGSFALLVNNTDLDLSKLPLLPRSPTVETVLGETFPPMFGYRSVKFPADRDTIPYGLVVSVDSSVIGNEERFEMVELTPEYMRNHPEIVMYLVPAMIKAARKEGLSISDLTFSEVVDANILEAKLDSYMKYIKTGKRTAHVTYTRTPRPVAHARLNGIPLGLVMIERDQADPLYGEFGFGLQRVEDQWVGTIPRGVFQNKRNPEDSLAGDILYRPVSRDQSRAAASAGNPHFGLMEILIMSAYQITDLSVQFTQVEEDQTAQDMFTRASETMLSDLTRKSVYTAGESKIGNIQRVTVETIPVSFGSVLVRDVFCLVHKELESDAKPYGSPNP